MIMSLTVSAAAQHFMRVNQDKRDNVIVNNMVTSPSKSNRIVLLHLLTDFKHPDECRPHVGPNYDVTKLLM